MAHEVEVERDRWIASLDFRFPAELHVRHHALPRLDQGQGRVLNIRTGLYNDLLVGIGCLKINFLLCLRSLLLINRVFCKTIKIS